MLDRLDACTWALRHLDKYKDKNESLSVLRKKNFSKIQPMFSITQNPIHNLNNKEIWIQNNLLGTDAMATMHAGT